MTDKCSKKDKYCCNQLFKLIEKDSLRLYYDESLRMYLLGCVSNSGWQTIFYCFCCGVKFPKNLRKKWYLFLTKQYNIKDPWDDESEAQIPLEFLTDEWWKKRGL